MQIFKVIQSALGLRHDKELQTQLVLNCHEEICNMYLVLHKFDEAAEFCEWGIQLMREVQEPSPQTNSCIASLQQHAGFAHASLFNFAAAESYYLKAKAYYSLKPAENGSEEKLVFLSKALESIQTVLRDQPWHDASMEVEKRISEGGSIITLEDCIIDFPMGSLPSDTNVHVSLKESMPDALSGLVPITPVIKLTPCTKLLRAATVKIETWCINQNGGEAYLYFKERGNSEWKQIQTLHFEHERLLEFQIMQFCEFCVVTKSGATGNEFAIETCLFHNKIGQLANFVIPHCSTKKRAVMARMRSREYRPTCSNDLILYAKMNDVISIALSPGDDEGEKFSLPERSPTISDELMRGVGETDQNFLLPKKCKGEIDLNHTAKLMRANRELKKVTHQDRVVLERPRSNEPIPQNVATVNYVTGQSSSDMSTKDGTFTLHAGNK